MLQFINRDDLQNEPFDRLNRTLERLDCLFRQSVAQRLSLFNGDFLCHPQSSLRERDFDVCSIKF